MVDRGEQRRKPSDRSTLSIDLPTGAQQVFPADARSLRSVGLASYSKRLAVFDTSVARIPKTTVVFNRKKESKAARAGPHELPRASPKAIEDRIQNGPSKFHFVAAMGDPIR